MSEHQEEDWGAVGPGWHHGPGAALRGRYEECVYTTPKLEFENASAMLQLHINTVHPVAQPQAPTVPAHGQTERVKRPIRSFTGQTLEPDEFEHFRYQFVLNKDRLGGAQDGRCSSASALLWTCPGLSSAATVMGCRTSPRNSYCWPSPRVALQSRLSKPE